MTTQAVSGRRYFTKAWLLEQKSLIALLVLIAIVSTLSPNFFTVNNLFNILQQTSVNAIMAVGMTLVILTSGIDLSVGSLLALTGAVAASIVGVEVNALVAVAAALALGAAIGAVTGVTRPSTATASGFYRKRCDGCRRLSGAISGGASYSAGYGSHWL